MSNKCFVCNLPHLEMISISRHPQKLDCMLKLLLGLQPNQDDYLCRACCDEVINVFDSMQKFQKRNLHGPKLRSNDGTAFKNEIRLDFDLCEIKSTMSESEMKIEPKTDEAVEADFEARIFSTETKNIEVRSEAQAAGEYGSERQRNNLKKHLRIKNLYAGPPEYFNKDESVDIEGNDGKKKIIKVAGSQELKVRRQIKNKFILQIIRNKQSIQNNTKERLFTCSDCGENFTVINFEEHKRTRSCKKSYKCSTCGKIFSNSSNLRVHMRTHMKNKPYICSECGKGFTTSTNLKSHERTHTGEKPFECEHCHKAFANNSNYRVHVLSHAKEKPHVCSECKKSFVTSSKLKEHKRCHTGEKPYMCNQCSKTFARNTKFNAHIRTHMKEK